jgi:hypothetical protein
MISSPEVRVLYFITYSSNYMQLRPQVSVLAHRGDRICPRLEFAMIEFGRVIEWPQPDIRPEDIRIVRFGRARASPRSDLAASSENNILKCLLTFVAHSTF